MTVTKTKLTKKQLEQAAKLRSEGATWNAIRAKFGVKLGSSGWFRAWEREGIEHIPAGQRPKPVKPAPAPTPPAAKPARRTVKPKPADDGSKEA